MTMEPVPQPATFEEVLQAVDRADWELVDSNLPLLADLPETLGWADANLENPDSEDRRDFAASVFEARTDRPDEQQVERLRTRMREDEGTYVRFRSAFALVKHGDHSDDVIAKLHEALEDEDVAEIAQGYLDQLEAEK